MNNYIPWIHEKNKEPELQPLYKELENPAFYIPREDNKEEVVVIAIEL